jgi:hypothetical protein
MTIPLSTVKLKHRRIIKASINAIVGRLRDDISLHELEIGGNPLWYHASSLRINLRKTRKKWACATSLAHGNDISWAYAV